MNQHIQHTIVIPETCQGERLDKTIADLLPQYSRNLLKQWIEQQRITVNQQAAKPKDKLNGGETITIQATLASDDTHLPEAIPLDIIYQDEHIVVINKPTGLVVHPAAGNREGTLLNALLHYFPELAQLPRAGIIHRIDKDTSGLLVIARSIEAHTQLVRDLQEHAIQREYAAVVVGALISGGTIDAPIGRHPRHRIKMAVVESGKPATTHYRVTERFRQHTLIKVMLETGRTHQIRVHMAHIHHPIVGDQAYAGRLCIPKNCHTHLADVLRHFKRQALHAQILKLAHPITKIAMEFTAPLPEDIEMLLQALREDDDAQLHTP